MADIPQELHIAKIQFLYQTIFRGIPGGFEKSGTDRHHGFDSEPNTKFGEFG